MRQNVSISANCSFRIYFSRFTCSFRYIKAFINSNNGWMIENTKINLPICKLIVKNFRAYTTFI